MISMNNVFNEGTMILLIQILFFSMALQPGVILIRLYYSPPLLPNFHQCWVIFSSNDVQVRFDVVTPPHSRAPHGSSSYWCPFTSQLHKSSVRQSLYMPRQFEPSCLYSQYLYLCKILIFLDWISLGTTVSIGLVQKSYVITMLSKACLGCRLFLDAVRIRSVCRYVCFAWSLGSMY